LMLDRLMVDVPEDPWTMVSEAALGEIAKSGDGGRVTVTETVTEWTRVPLVPVAVTV